MTKNSQKSLVGENLLEQSLIEAQSNLIPLNEFLRKFLQEQIFVLSFSSVESDGSGIKPLMFDREEVMMVAAFTSLSRASQFTEPNMYCLEIKGDDFLERIPEGYGLVLNPGSTVGLEIPPLGVKNIRRDRVKIIS
jgi:SseB protein N-terminal domain